MTASFCCRYGRITASLLTVTLLTGAASAHQKWFYDAGAYPFRWDLLWQGLPLAFLSGSLLLTLLVGLAWHLRGGRGFLPGPELFGDLPLRRAALYGLVPAILGIHIAVPLLVNGVLGDLFSPNNPLPGAWAFVIGLVQTGVALAFFYGGFARPAAAVLAGLWLTGVFVLGLEPMLENVHYLAFAAFFVLAGRGPIAIDRLIFPNLEPPASWQRLAPLALRVGIGINFVVLSLTEKLARLPYAEAFLQEYPLNFTAFFGIPMHDHLFVLFAGAVELLIGLCLIFGLFTREVIVVAWLPFNLTLTVFNWVELIGHLPIYGAMALLLIWSPHEKESRLWLSGLREGPLPTAPQSNTLA